MTTLKAEWQMKQKINMLEYDNFKQQQQYLNKLLMLGSGVEC